MGPAARASRPLPLRLNQGELRKEYKKRNNNERRKEENESARRGKARTECARPSAPRNETFLPLPQQHPSPYGGNTRKRVGGFGEGEQAARVASRSNPPRPVLFHPRARSRDAKRSKQEGGSAAKEMARDEAAGRVGSKSGSRQPSERSRRPSQSRGRGGGRRASISSSNSGGGGGYKDSRPNRRR